MNPVKVGLLGLGTVGGGTLNVLVRNAAEIARRAGEMFELVASNRLTVRVQRELSLEQADEAHRILEGRGTTGKLLLRIHRDSPQ